MEEEEKRFDLTSCFARLRRGFEFTPRRERRDVFLRLAPTQVGFERKEKNINTSGELLAKCGAARIGNSFGICEEFSFLKLISCVAVAMRCLRIRIDDFEL